jgi:L-ascorbate metabolism protein UlaG (beta-lactamase superfamily)
VQPCTPPERVSGDAARITVVNHSTVLIQYRLLNVLTDPIWSERASPVQWAGPKRKRAPGVRLEDLPPIDAVLISHNHYDHLDIPTLRKIAAALFIVPTGVAATLKRHSIGPVIELDWGDSAAAGPIEVHAVPALHFSARTPFDRNRTLWCGYVLQSEASHIYFAADTTFGEHFQGIRDAFGRPRVAILPIGAYLPRWFMGRVHMGPDEAVKASTILQPETSIAIHHGTFQLADDAVDTPARRLREIPGGERIRILRNGEFLELP